MFAKTRKRELAFALVVTLIVLSLYAMASEDPLLVTARGSIIAVLALPILGFAAAAYGMDWISKQTEWGGEPLPKEGTVTKYETMTVTKDEPDGGRVE